MAKIDEDFAARREALRASDNMEIKALKEYFSAKDAPAGEDLADSRQGIVDAAYDSIAIAREKLEAVSPDDNIPHPFWVTHVVDRHDIATSVPPTAFYTITEKGEGIAMHPEMLTMYTPREIAAVYVHEAGHDLDNIQQADGTTEKQKECIADHTAQALGYGDELSSALNKLAAKVDLSNDTAHPAISERVAALADKAREKLPIGSVKFDDHCRIMSSGLLESPITPESPTTGVNKIHSLR